MALCLDCGNDDLERIQLSQPTYPLSDIDWPDINILDPVYEPFFSLHVANNMPRKTTGTKSTGAPRAPIACERCRKRKVKCSGDKGDGSACSNCRTGNASNQCNWLRVGAVQALPTDFSIFMNPAQQASQCATPSSGDTLSLSPIDDQNGLVYEEHHESHRQSQQGSVIGKHPNNQNTTHSQQPPTMPSTSYSWSNGQQMPLLTSSHNPRSVSYNSSQTPSFSSQDTRDSFERPRLRPIQQQSFQSVPGERQTLPSLSTTIPYTPPTLSSGSSTSYNNFAGPFNDGSRDNRLQTPRVFVPAYGQLNSSNHDSQQHVPYHESNPTSPNQLAPLLQYAATTSRRDDFTSGLTLPPFDSKYVPAQYQQQGQAYHYEASAHHDVKHPVQYQHQYPHPHQEHQQQHHHHQRLRPQTQDQYSITSPLQSSYINNAIPPASHQALPGFSTFPSPFPDFHELYAPAQPCSSGTSMLGMSSFPPMSSSGYGGFQPMQAGHLEQPEHILGSSRVGAGRRGSARRETRKRRSVVD